MVIGSIAAIASLFFMVIFGFPFKNYVYNIIVIIVIFFGGYLSIPLILMFINNLFSLAINIIIFCLMLLFLYGIGYLFMYFL